MIGNRPSYGAYSSTDETERFSVGESPSPWYLKRWVLALWGLAVITLIAVIIYGLARPGAGQRRQRTGAHHHADIDARVVTHHHHALHGAVDHRADHRADHDDYRSDHRPEPTQRELDAAASSPPLEEQFAPNTPDTALLSRRRFGGHGA